MNITDRKCPKCGGCLKYADHPHAFGHKDVEHVECRRRKTCGKRFDTVKLEAWFKAQDAKGAGK